MAVFPPSILHNPTSAQYGEIWNIKSPAPPPPVSALIYPASGSSYSFKVFTGVGVWREYRERPSINDEFPESSQLYPARAALTHSPDSYLKNLRRNSGPYRVSLCSLNWNVQKRGLFPTPTSAGGRWGRGSVLYDLLLELCNVPYRTQPTDYVWAFASPTVGDGMQVPHLPGGYGLHPTRKKEKRRNLYILT